VTASGLTGSSALTATESALPPGTLTPASPDAVADPAPASVVNGPPLRQHEVFGFAPYWALPGSSGFDLAGLTTVAYFSIGINPDGTLDESGPGWQGLESQQFITLVDRAHAAGDRVVLTANDFAQASLDSLTSSAPAAQRLGQGLLQLVRSKSLDGVNLDLEGDGAADQTGLTNLVTTVSSVFHSANARYQVTMDTYASSAGDPSGFYNIPALSHVVDAFFVMAYELNLKAAPNPGSAMTSTMFSNETAAQQYANAAPAAKVILGLPFFGYDWPTSNGTLTAQPEGAPATITAGQEVSSGRPVYWDADTDTAWSSYQVGSQWHEAFFENPTSLYMGAQLAQQYGLGGVGIWALGMDGSDDAAMVSALDGQVPAQKDELPGPSGTSSSSESVPDARPQSAAPPPVAAAAAATTTTSVTGTPRRSPAPTARPTPTTTTTTQATYTTGGMWQGQPVALARMSAPSGSRTELGILTAFVTNDPALSCLTKDALEVFSLSADPSHDYVLAREPTDCANAAFAFVATAPSVASTTTTTTTGLAPAGSTGSGSTG
jgi:Glycosyl hydrolases family 18